MSRNPSLIHIALACCILLASCMAGNHAQKAYIKMLQRGELRQDSSFIYTLPYETGKAHCIVQGYLGPFSHKNRIALDFKMKSGTKIVSAREGVVMRASDTSNRGGWSRKYRRYGNYIIIRHPDGSRASYWHLQQNGALVSVGDSIRQGQIIGLSGRTGFAFMPHLHFTVSENINGQWRQVPTRFYTSKGVLYPKAFKRYRRK